MEREGLKDALVGVVASSTCRAWSVSDAPAERGVVGEVMLVFASAFGNGEFTGRNALDMVEIPGEWKMGRWRAEAKEGEKGEKARLRRYGGMREVDMLERAW